jgi:hypothetical protein
MSHPAPKFQNRLNCKAEAWLRPSFDMSWLKPSFRQPFSANRRGHLRLMIPLDSERSTIQDIVHVVLLEVKLPKTELSVLREGSARSSGLTDTARTEGSSC